MEMNLSKIDWQQEASPRERVYFVIVMILIVFLAFRILWLPISHGMKTKKMEISNLKLQISTLEKFTDLDKKLAPQQPAIKKEEIDKKIEEILKKSSDDPQKIMSSVIRDVTSRSKLGNLILNDVTFQPPVAQSGYASMPVAIVVEGTYSSIETYLSKLEKIEYLFTVDNIKFQVSEAHPGLVVAELTAKLYLGSFVITEPLPITVNK